MNKKILIISASPRRGGNSDTLCDRFMDGAKEAGHETEKIFLRDLDINFCMGCNYCASHDGCCTIKDDTPVVIDKMIAADVIVLSTPVYFYSMNAQLRTVIDRSVMRYNQIKDKDFYLIATAAEDEETTMNGTITSFRGFLDCLENSKEAGRVLARGVWNIGDISGHPAMMHAYNAGKEI